VSAFYSEDLAYVHDSGFSRLSECAGAQVLAALDAVGIKAGLIVDLGCGSGVWAAMACAAGFSVLGVDVSGPMLRLARSAAPSADFRLASLYETEIPQCVAVTAFGEALNYNSPDTPTRSILGDLFGRVASGLAAGGLFVFDVLIQSDGPPLQYRSWSTGQDYAVLVDVRESADERALHRDITLFRKIGEGYRRSEEHHTLSVFDDRVVRWLLSSAGFATHSATRYGDYALGDRRTAFFARKTACSEPGSTTRI